MRSDNLRPVSDALLAELGLSPAPFKIDPDPPKEAAILAWNKPASVEVKRDYSPRHRPVTAPNKAVKKTEAAPVAPPKPDHRAAFAKQLIGFARSLSDAQIAKAAGVSVETVTQLRGAGNEG